MSGGCHGVRAGLVFALASLAACTDAPTDRAVGAGPASVAEAPAADSPAAGIEVEAPWSRTIPPNAPVAAAYLRIHNAGAADDRLLGALSPAAKRAEIHDMVEGVDGVMRMRQVAGGLPVPAGATVELRPGGLHLMLFEPDTARWRGGGELPLTLLFERAGQRTVQLQLRADGEAPSAADPTAVDHRHH